jgi:hypothetical protein
MIDAMAGRESPAAGAGTAGGNSRSGDDIVDAEFEEVKDRKAS